MKRLTKNISDKQTYCGYEVKNCKYQQIYDFKRYNELEDYVDCDLTLAIDKLGELEDLEEQLGCPLEVRCKITTDTTIYDAEGNSFEISYIHDNNFTAIMNCGFGSNYEFDFAYSDYKKTWWLKEDKSE